MGTGKPQKFPSNISNNEIIPDENFPDYGTNKIDIVIIFNSSAHLNSIACHFATLDITANYHAIVIISSIILEF